LRKPLSPTLAKNAFAARRELTATVAAIFFAALQDVPFTANAFNRRAALVPELIFAVIAGDISIE